MRDVDGNLIEFPIWLSVVSAFITNPMLLAGFVVAAVSSALLFTYMVRYPKRWGARIDVFHQSIRPYGLSFAWMQRMEKGVTLKALVLGTTVLILCCVAVLLRHPSAMADFLLEYSRPLSL